MMQENMHPLFLQFDDTACVNATFDNVDTSLDVVLGWNGKAIYEKDFSFSNFTKDCAKVRLMFRLIVPLKVFKNYADFSIYPNQNASKENNYSTT